MGRLKVSCEQAGEFLDKHEFEFKKKMKDFRFSYNTIKFKYKFPPFNPNLKVEFILFRDGILYVKTTSRNVFVVLVKIFVGINRNVDRVLKKAKLDQFVEREKSRSQLVLKIKVNEFLETMIKGIIVQHIKLENKELLVDFLCQLVT
jgi:hypothetical protein